ncbi:MAG TPA: tryptophan synthase subunit alpha [Labilithrix sp.]
MGRLEAAFDKRASEGKRVLVAYLCVGDPSEEESVDLALACAEAGADVLELGCPFSDPTADGAAIARAAQRALAKGGGLDATLRVARAVRDKSEVPIVLFGYYNPLFVRGDEEAMVISAAAGIDALLVVDVPVDESLALRATAAASGMAVIPLVAPTTTPDRVALVGDVAKRFPVPFVYYVSMTGVTGGSGAEAVLAEAGDAAARVREATGRPTVVGFGIDTPSRARLAAAKADGIVVGSAIVRRIEDGQTPEERVAGVRALVGSLRAAI